MNEDAVATVKPRARQRELAYNQARCNICHSVVQGLSDGPWVKFLCHCKNHWKSRPIAVVPVVASNGAGNGKAKAATATCPECGHHFSLTTNGANGNGKSNGKHH